MLVVLPEARTEAIEAAAWYDRKQSGLGDDFLDEVQQALTRVEQSSDTLPKWEPYTGHREIRRCRLRRFPYAVIFECLGDYRVVVAVSHGRRHPLYWLARLG